jgi:2',3'-cyclic-nucleotide 2'-phosphodiesterase (5'-nucleotidase family)
LRLTLLHTNDIHGRIDGLARVATLVERERAAADHPVLYVDVGDIEESTVRLSNITKGAGMHRVLSAAGCEMSCVGNATWLRYGPQVLTAAAAEATYPLLLANLRPVAGVTPSAVVQVAGDRIGFIGITDPFPRFLGSGLDYGIESVPILPLVRELARELRAEGANLVVLLSHVGYENPNLDLDDRVLAHELQDDVDLIIGAHSHTLLPAGDRSHGVPIAQAGAFAEHLGRVEIDGEAVSISVVPVDGDVAPSSAVLAAAAEAERDADAFLDQEIGVLDASLDVEYVAEVMRERMHADVGLAVEGAMLGHDLPPGVVTRRVLWDVCHSTANPGVVEMDGARLATILERGHDPEFQRSTRRALRGKPAGRLGVVGLAGAPEPGRMYRVAATDAELESYGGLVEDEWQLEVQYDFPTIVREAIEEHLRADATMSATAGEQPSTVPGTGTRPKGSEGPQQLEQAGRPIDD